MAVTRADREVELQQLEKAFKGTDTAVLVDYKGMNVPQVTELRRQLRTAKASYKVVKNTLARRALKGTPLEVLEQYFAGTTAVAYTAADPIALAKTLTTFVKVAPTLTIKAAIVSGRAIKPAEVTELASSATGISACRVTGCLPDTAPAGQLAVPLPLAQPPVYTGFWLDGWEVRATVTAEADPSFLVETWMM